MAETIYTIPINEVFEENMADGSDSCPFCTLAAKLETDELELILGASMMEPDIRIKTNKQGFCSAHFTKMLRISKRLPLALMLESHLGELSGAVNKKGLMKPSPDKIAKILGELSDDCYVCSRIEYNMKRLISNAVYMWQTDDEFRKKLSAQPYICIGHAAAMLRSAASEMKKRDYSDFSDAMTTLVGDHLCSLCDDVSTFARSFDYRYADEKLDAETKISVERSVRFLAGDKTVDISKI